MAAILGHVKGELLVRIGRGKPRVIGTSDIPVEARLPETKRRRARAVTPPVVPPRDHDPRVFG